MTETNENKVATREPQSSVMTAVPGAQVTLANIETVFGFERQTITLDGDYIYSADGGKTYHAFGAGAKQLADLAGVFIFIPNSAEINTDKGPAMLPNPYYVYNNAGIPLTVRILKVAMVMLPTGVIKYLPRPFFMNVAVEISKMIMSFANAKDWEKNPSGNSTPKAKNEGAYQWCTRDWAESQNKTASQSGKLYQFYPITSENIGIAIDIRHWKTQELVGNLLQAHQVAVSKFQTQTDRQLIAGILPGLLDPIDIDIVKGEMETWNDGSKHKGKDVINSADFTVDVPTRSGAILSAMIRYFKALYENDVTNRDLAMSAIQQVTGQTVTVEKVDETAVPVVATAEPEWVDAKSETTSGPANVSAPTIDTNTAKRTDAQDAAIVNTMQLMGLKNTNDIRASLGIKHARQNFTIGEADAILATMHDRMRSELSNLLGEEPNRYDTLAAQFNVKELQVEEIPVGIVEGMYATYRLPEDGNESPEKS